MNTSDNTPAVIHYEMVPGDTFRVTVAPKGFVGPTTGSRMDAYSPRLMEMGLKIMIGKGSRSEEVIEAIKKHGGIYFAAIGVIAALMARSVESAKVNAFEDLGTEAIHHNAHPDKATADGDHSNRVVTTPQSPPRSRRGNALSTASSMTFGK